jgi:uncharacterized protein YdeI (YjbR/CyaY-like superfamily)
MKTTDTLYLTDRNEWRNWLKKNHNIKKEIWLIYYKKHTGKPRIPYEDAVEEAICFGWIDSTIRRIDNEKFMQKFTPRNIKSNWSDLNKERAKKMIKLDKMTESGYKKIEKVDLDSKEQKPVKNELMAPDDLIKELKNKKNAWKNFNKLAPSYKRQYIGWLNTTKKKETRLKRINEITDKLEKNQKLGMK